MPTLIISKGTRKGQVALSKRDDDNREVASACGPFLAAKHFREAAGDLGVEVKVFRDAVVAVRDGESESEEIDLTPPASAFEVSVRGIRERGDGAITFTDADPVEALRLALAYVGHPAGEPVISWGDLDRLAAVDVDYHRQAYADRPSEAQAYARMSAAIPRAVAVWQTHGRGLRLIYGARAGYTAGELAAVAALAIATHDPSARVELKHETRHPGYPRGDQVCGPVRIQTPDADVDGIRAWLGRVQADDGAAGEWLASRGFEVGRRYPHSRCPARPDEGGDRDPVHVRDDGILCYACRGRGVTHGSRSPGWFPYKTLCGCWIENNLSRAIRCFTHWEHARHIIEASTHLEGDVARLAYRAALRVVHGDDARDRIDAVFAKGRNLLRFDGYWGNQTGSPYTTGLEHLLAELPATGGVKAQVARMQQTHDLAEYGYPALTPVRGSRIFGEYLSPDGGSELSIVVQTPDLAKEGRERVRPRYRLKANRMPIDDAWNVIEEACPGVNREYVQLLIAARGCQEGGQGLPPMIFVSGPTSAGKTGTAHLAAAMIGDKAIATTYARDEARMKQSIQSGKKEGSFCLLDEYLKGAVRDGRSPECAMQFALNLTPESQSHAMYVGPVRLGRPPVFVWTDTSIPDSVRQNAQIARRIIAVELTATIQWSSAVVACGVGELGNLRWEGSFAPRFAEAADAIVSDVIDRYFTQSADFQEIARTLGFLPLADSEGAKDGDADLREFFRAVCRAPLASESDQNRHGGRGWKTIPLYGESESATAWRGVADQGLRDSMRCKERDWAKLLGVPGPVKFESKVRGSTLFARFIRRETRERYQVNEELVEASPVEASPVEASPVEAAPVEAAPVEADLINLDRIDWHAIGEKFSAMAS